MKVAIDNSPLTSGDKYRGIGFQTREFLRAFGKFKNSPVEIDVVDFAKTDLSKYDIAHYLHFHPHFLTLPKTKQAKRVIVTIDDLIPLIYPKHYPPGFQGSLNLIKQKQRLKNVDAIITISETSKKDIVDYLGVDPSIVYPIHLAPKKIFIKKANNTTALRSTVVKKYNLPKRFVLYVGDVNYNKNVSGLIQACRSAKIKLVIVGKQALDIDTKGMDLIGVEGPRDWARFLFNVPHPEEVHYIPLLKVFAESKNIIRTGFVTDEEQGAIFSLATLYCQPSFYEGFGLPILEAMVCGVPVVAARNDVHKEVAGSAALFARPGNLGSAIKKMLKSSKSEKC